MAEIMADCNDLKDGATVMLGGFGDTGVAVKLVDALRELSLSDLTIVSNGAGGGEYGLALLIKSGSVGKIICSFPRSSDSKIFEELYAAGKIELETVPQGTLAERIRAGGAGIPAFYTATAFGTPLADGKEIRVFNDRHYVMERSICADIALVHAATGDRWGNLTYRSTARNFNPVMATAASTTLVEVRKLVDIVPPEEVITPGIFVDRMIEVGDYI